MIEHARDPESIDHDLLVGQNTDARASDGLDVMRRDGKFLMIAGGEVNAQGWRKGLERREQAVEVAFGAIEEVAGKKDDVGMASRGQRDQPAAETDAVDGPEVQIAEQDCTTAAP